MMKGILSIFALTVLLFVTGFGQVQINVDYNLLSNTSTQIVLEVYVWDDTPSIPTKLSAMTTALNKDKAFGTTAPSWVESVTFMPLNQPSPTMTASGSPTGFGQVRATQSPIGNEPGSVLLSGSPVLYGTITINSSTAISYPVTFTPNGTSGSGLATLQATKYDSDGMGGWQLSSSITFSAGQIAWPDGSLTVQAPLPIEFSEVSAHEDGRSNKILWSTASEQNNEKHIVERSANGYDGWLSVAQVSSKNSGNGASYNAYDQKPLKVSYYRIKSVDFDGKYDYSKIVKVERSGQRSDIVQVYPVPTTGKVTVQLETDHTTSLDIQVTDVAGKLLMTSRHDTASGHNEIPLDLSSFHSGTYYIKIDNGVSQYTKRVIKE